MNLIGDDGKHKSKRKITWNANKKKYMQMMVGKDGKSKTIRNESGAIITDKDKKPELYKKWMKKTLLRVQKAGEVENEKGSIEAAMHMRERKSLSGAGGRDSDKCQMKKPEQVLKMKKRNVLKKERTSNKFSKHRTQEFRKKIDSKIKSRQRPSRSKVVQTGGKRNRK